MPNSPIKSEFDDRSHSGVSTDAVDIRDQSLRCKSVSSSGAKAYNGRTRAMQKSTIIPSSANLKLVRLVPLRTTSLSAPTATTLLSANRNSV